MVAKAVEALRRIGKSGEVSRSRSAMPVGHRIRIEILAALHEGPESADGLAKIVRRSLSTVSHHIEELLKDGSIEIARIERVGNLTQNFCAR